jgi:hypothetical protein
MPRRKIYFIGFVLPFCTFISCLHSRTSPPSFAIEAGIKILYGSARLKIDGKINENLYSYNPNQIRDEKYYENPFIEKGSITKNETKHLVTGDEYTFSVLPTEVVSVNIVSSDGNDVEIIAIASHYGKRKKHTVKGTNRLGLFLAFQNR